MKGKRATSTILIKLSSAQLANPDLDIRYALPNMLVQRSSGGLADDGYDYGENGDALLIFLRTCKPSESIPIILNVICTEKTLGNDLSSAVVAVSDDTAFRVVHPKDLAGSLLYPRSH